VARVHNYFVLSNPAKSSYLLLSVCGFCYGKIFSFGVGESGKSPILGGSRTNSGFEAGSKSSGDAGQPRNSGPAVSFNARLSQIITFHSRALCQTRATRFTFAGSATYQILDQLDGFNITPPVSGSLLMRGSPDALQTMQLRKRAGRMTSDPDRAQLFWKAEVYARAVTSLFSIFRTSVANL
jgi:hypothetical protein